MTLIWSWLFILALIVPDLSSSLLHCPSRCHCDDEKLDVNCEEGHLDVVPIALNPSIQRLVIRNNKIRIIDSSVQFYSELTLLDLSYNYLFNIPDRTFARQSKLQQLHLNHNKISVVSNRTFVGLGELLVLNLRGNLIDQIEALSFTPLAKLEELNLGQNRITSLGLSVKGLVGVGDLKILYLDDNRLEEVPEEDFWRPVEKLAELYVGTNMLARVKDGAFAVMSELTLLDLRSSLLTNVSTDTFAGIENIKGLNLADNRFQRVPSKALAILRRLEELSIGQNYFETLPANAFRGLSNLKRFELRGSLYLNRIDRAAFQTNTNLESIAIDSNKALMEMEEGTFAGLLFLKHLSLRNNGFQRLDESMFSWNNLRTLDISDNLINCDCYYSKLLHRLQTASRISYNATGCPHHLPDQWECEYILDKNKNLISVLVLAVAIVTAIALTFYRFRGLLREYVHNGCKNKSHGSGGGGGHGTGTGAGAGGLDTVDYEKAISTGDDDYVFRQSNLYSNHQVQPILNGYPSYMQQNNVYNYQKPLPITEL
ncbi:insulin-like growth factor-binding protein complex acid labile subunit [Uranotaenia lowii]|uniref:insulin-like growth factor-binding protein complex acid labile subunit n=1 Tax=Uranotaenia lowii TaxID=190385 RepID=UPI00247A7B3A|nr:insulin-like growth factor-binding protein complex acid labile subunit [Uranotaenia lowii]XP_055599534.1 insulin-like growth factor-binding protein complex acid labile subunit [Uranotaenia lowii]